VAVASAVPYADLHLGPDDNHVRIPPISFSQDGCHPTNSIKALKAGL